jgi:3',5'-nucleoside bisphosphate phosphatase
MNEFRADLHCHTTVSDGTFTPREILQEAKRLGLSGLSITDHDTVDAYSVAIPYAQELGVDLVSGVEFSTDHLGTMVHVLGYGFNTEHPSITKLCEYHKKRRIERFLEMLHLLQREGFELQEADFDLLDGTIGRPHLAKGLVDGGHVRSISEAFNKYLGDDKCCYVSAQTISTEDTLKVIHEANAFAVIAHPHLMKNQNVLLDLLKLPFDGIEGYYARFAPAQEKRWVQIGAYRGWLITGGSDFHGETKPNIPLGCSWVGSELFDRLQQRYQENLHV